LCGPTRIAKIITGIALAMRFVHSRGAIHHGLCPANVLLAWDWSVRIADFARSSSFEAQPLPRDEWHSPNLRCFAPECHDRNCGRASDVFSFALILFEILVGRPPLPESLNHWQIAWRIVRDERPEIPEFVRLPARALIEDCWAIDPDDRPTFDEIVDRLAEMQFKVTADVKSANVVKFVRRIEELEKRIPNE
jgi:serine/threonine protein kinase